MDEQSAPVPKPQSAAPRPQSAASVAGYAAPPAAARGRRLWPLTALAAAALGALGVGLVRRSASTPAAAPEAVVQAVEKRASFQKDFDAETTAAAREVLRRDATTHELAALPADDAARSPALQQALRRLAAGPQELRDGVADGRIGFYTIRLPTPVGDGGDVYDISVDGTSMLRITTRPGLARVTIPLDAAKPHVIAQTLVFAAPRGAEINAAAIEPLPASLAEFPAVAVERTQPKSARCVVDLSDGDGKNERQIGDFPCDCGAVHWTGNVGACAPPK